MTRDKPKTLLFSLTKKDFKMQTFAAGGKGGQKQNSTNSGVRFIHPESGAIGEARDSRHQWQNKENAFRRMAETPEFKAWHKLEVARRLGTLSDPALDRKINARVDKMMREENLKIEEF